MTVSRALPPRAHHGFSLIELMIAMTLSLLLMASLGGLLQSAGRSYRADERHLRLQEEARFGLAQLVADLEMAGFRGRIPADSTMQPGAGLPAGFDCRAADEGDRALLEPALASVDNGDAARARQHLPCLGDSTLKSGTDLVMVRRLRSPPVDEPQAGRLYLRENGLQGLLFAQPPSAGVPPVPPDAAELPGPWSLWHYSPVLYFVRAYSVHPGDGLSSLCRRELGVDGGRPAWRSECLALGVEDLQLEYGIDGSPQRPADGTPDYYVDQPSDDEQAAITAVRVLMRVRAELPDRSYLNRKRYRLANSPLPAEPGDHYHRKTLATTVLLRNVALRQRQTMSGGSE